MSEQPWECDKHPGTWYGSDGCPKCSDNMELLDALLDSALAVQADTTAQAREQAFSLIIETLCPWVLDCTVRMHMSNDLAEDFLAAGWQSPEQVAAQIRVAERRGASERRDLRCPYCGDEFTTELAYTSMAYSEHRDLMGYECDNFECDAAWDKSGKLVRVPRLARGISEPTP